MTSTTRRSVDFATTNVPEIIQKSIVDFTREDLYIGLPAKVVGVDKYETEQVVDVQPLINDIYLDTEITRAVKIGSVFVKLPSGNGFSVKYPIAVGDLVTLHYCHRDIGSFLDGNGNDVDSPLSLIAGLRDCYVIPGFGTRNKNQKPSKTNFIIEGANTKITITPQGKIDIKAKVCTIDAEETTFVNDVNFNKKVIVNDTVNAANFIADTFDALGHRHSNGNQGQPTGTYIP